MIVHYMQHGQTACFKIGLPKTWAPNHRWSNKWSDVTCRTCLLNKGAETYLFKAKKKAKRKPKLTLEDVVTAAVAAGATVNVKLLPNEVQAAAEYLRPLLKLPANEWPGNPGCRSIVAGLDITRKEIERVFRDNPGSKWVITPYEIIEREAFLQSTKTKTTTTTPVNPS